MMKFKCKHCNKEILIPFLTIHPTQQSIIDEMIAGVDINKITLRALGESIGVENKPQIIKHHLNQLIAGGYINMIDGKKVLSESIMYPNEQIPPMSVDEKEYYN